VQLTFLRILAFLSNIKWGTFAPLDLNLEAKIAKNKDLYYAALNREQDSWLDGTDREIRIIAGRLSFYTYREKNLA